MKTTLAIIVLLVGALLSNAKPPGTENPDSKDGRKVSPRALNPTGTTWLIPWDGAGMLSIWKTMEVPKQFYFRKTGTDSVLCTDSQGEVLWQADIPGIPLWDYTYNARAFLFCKGKTATITWLSSDNGKKSRQVSIDMPEHCYDKRFMVGQKDGDCVCRWEEGQPPLGVLNPKTTAPLRFYSEGKLTTVWEPEKAGFRMLRDQLGRNTDGTYVAIGDKAGTYFRVTFSNIGKLLKLTPVDYLDKVSYYRGDYKKGPVKFGFQLKKNVLKITRENIFPNTSGGDDAYTSDRAGKPVPSTVLWQLQVEGDIWDVGAEKAGLLPLYTAIRRENGNDWRMIWVSMKERRVVKTTPVFDTGNFLIGSFANSYYSERTVRVGSGVKTAKKVLWYYELD